MANSKRLSWLHLISHISWTTKWSALNSIRLSTSYSIERSVILTQRKNLLDFTRIPSEIWLKSWRKWGVRWRKDRNRLGSTGRDKATKISKDRFCFRNWSKRESRGRKKPENRLSWWERKEKERRCREKTKTSKTKMKVKTQNNITIDRSLL